MPENLLCFEYNCNEAKKVSPAILSPWDFAGIRAQQRGSRDQIDRPAEPFRRVPVPTRRTDIDELVEEIASEEPIITESKKPQLKTLIESR